ncbi:MAG: PAS domain S-box protein [Nanoarchaeota archaeon]|nr:PAS domain S-box protein [Nanoarchaeota archaeon]
MSFFNFRKNNSVPENLESLIEQVESKELRTNILKAVKNIVKSKDSKYKLVVENVNDSIVISQNERFIFFNNQFSEILGYNSEELFMKDYRNVFTPEGVEILKDREKRRLAGEFVSPRYESTFKRKDKSIVHVEANVRIIDYQGALATFAVIRDISERVIAEKAKEDDRIKALEYMNESPAAMYTVELESGEFIFTNKAYRDMFGYSKSDIKNITVKDTYDYVKDRNGFLNKIIKNKFVDNYKVLFKKSNGETFRGSVTAKFQEKKDDVVMGIINLDDLTSICAKCKKIREDGEWAPPEKYISEHTNIVFSHGVCPDCMKELYPDFVRK